MLNCESFIIGTKEKKKWLELVDNSDIKDIYHTPEYCSIYEEDYGLKEINNNFCGEARLFFYGNDEEYVILPFIKRKINNLDFVGNHFNKEIYDITSPYGYVGPIWKNVNATLIKSFLMAFNKYCKENDIITEFIRFNPLLKNHEIVRDNIKITKRNETVYIDLNQNSNAILKNMNKKTRNLIRKAEKRGVKIKISTCKEDLKEFTKVYLDRMSQLNTTKMYFFPFKFFENTLEKLKRDASLFIAKLNNKIIAGSLVIYRYGLVHYHFSGVNREFRNLDPTNLLIYRVIIWAKLRGLKTLHLGGGHSLNKDDSLFHFKAGFSKTFSTFYTANKIHNLKNYEEICNLKNMYDNKRGLKIDKTGYFPAYRLLI